MEQPKCHRCKTMKQTRNNPNLASSNCNVCNHSYCSPCYDTHNSGSCYLCGSTGCYVHDIRKVVCYECL